MSIETLKVLEEVINDFWERVAENWRGSKSNDNSSDNI